MALQVEQEALTSPAGKGPGSIHPVEPAEPRKRRVLMIAALLILVLVVGAIIALQIRSSSAAESGDWSARDKEVALHFANFSFAEDLETTPSMDQVNIVRDRVEELFPDTSQWDLVRTSRLPLNIELSDDSKKCSQNEGWFPCWGMYVMFLDQQTDDWFGESLGTEGGAFLVGLDPQDEGPRLVTFDAEVGYPSAPDRASVTLELDLKAAPELSTSRMMGIESNAVLLTGSKGLAVLQELAVGLGEPSIADPFANVNPDFYGEVAVRFADPEQAGDLVVQLQETDWEYGFMTAHVLASDEDLE